MKYWTFALELWDLWKEEEKEGRIHPIPRLRTDLAAQREPRWELQDSHGGRHLPSGHQLRRDSLYPPLCWQVGTGVVKNERKLIFSLEQNKSSARPLSTRTRMQNSSGNWKMRSDVWEIYSRLRVSKWKKVEQFLSMNFPLKWKNVKTKPW